jgi:hypothetical protein
MGLEALKVALHAASALLKPGQMHFPSLFEEDGITPKRITSFELSEPIRSEIESIKELERLFQSPMHTLSSAGQLSSWHIAQASIHRLFAGAAPEVIISDLLDLARRDVCDNSMYIGLYGGGVSDKVELDENVAVMPAGAAPPSYARELIFGIDRWGRPLPHNGLPTWKPNVALVISEKATVFPAEEEFDFVRVRSIEEKTQRAIRALTLSSGHPFVRNWQMSWLNHPSVPYEGFGGWGASGSVEGMPQPRASEPRVVVPDLAKVLYARLNSLPAPVKAAVDLATDRLGRSRVHLSTTDTALDLGISSEIILLNAAGNSELKYRFSVRGAYLVSKTKTDREKNFEAFRAMYDARSSAAHTGALKPPAQARLAEFDALCCAAICRIVQDQKFPDWEKLVLGVSAESDS